MSNVIETVFRGVDEISGNVNQINSSISRAGAVIGSVTRVFAAFFAVQKFGEMAVAAGRVSDQMQEMNEVLAQVTTTAVEQQRVQQSLARVAVETDTAYRSTFETYVRLTQQAETYGLTEQQRLGIVRTLNQAMQLAGPLAGEVSAIFNRMLVTGEINGRSLVQLFQRAPRLAKALADELGVAQDKLVGLVNSGDVTFDKFLSALSNQAKAIQEDFDKTGQTVGESFTNLGTAITQVISKLDARIGITDALAKGLQLTAESILDFAERTPAEALQELLDVQERIAAMSERISGLPGGQQGDVERDRLQRRLAILIKQEEVLKQENNAYSLQRELDRKKEQDAAGKGSNFDSAVVAEVMRQRGDPEIEAAMNDFIAEIAVFQTEAAAKLSADAERIVNDTIAEIALHQLEVAAQIEADAERVINETLSGIADEQAKKLAEANEDAARRAETAWDQATRNIQTVLAEQLFNGFDDGLKGMLKSFIDMIRQMIAQALAAKLVEKMFGTAGNKSSGLGGLLGTVASSLFGGPRAAGGWTVPGAVHSINENEPEFLVSAGRDRVVPLSKLAANGLNAGGGGTLISNTTINTGGGGGFTMELEMALKRRDDALLARWRDDQRDGLLL